MRQRLRSGLSHANVAATLVSLAVLATAAVIALIAFGGGEAQAAKPLSCGNTITADATLHHNLVNCPNNGIIIGADDVTLDLNYHTIDGDGTTAAGCDPETEFCDVGVVNDGHDGVTVVHGSVHQFNWGVFVGRASHNRLLGISSTRNDSPQPCCGNTGFAFVRVTRSVMRNSSGSGSGAPGEEGTNGMFLAASHHVRILHSSFRRNGDGGMWIPDSTGNLIKGNLFSRNKPGDAIIFERSDRNQVRRNRIVRNGEGILLIDGSSQDVIARNRVRRAGHRGEGAGIKIEDGRGNLLAHNVILRGVGEDGVNVTHGAKHTIIRRNRARHSKDDGFDVANPTSKLTRNRAVGNTDLGIEAVRGVIDGGGNKASGNGDPRQCTHIVCR